MRFITVLVVLVAVAAAILHNTPAETIQHKVQPICNACLPALITAKDQLHFLLQQAQNFLSKQAASSSASSTSTSTSTSTSSSSASTSSTSASTSSASTSSASTSSTSSTSASSASTSSSPSSSSSKNLPDKTLPQVQSIISVVYHGEATPASRRRFPSDSLHDYDADGGYDQLVTRGAATMRALGREIAQAYLPAHTLASSTTQYSFAARSIKLAKCISSSLHLLAGAARATNQSLPSAVAATLIQAPELHQEFLFLPHELCYSVQLLIQNQLWSSASWRQTFFQNKYLVERLSDIGLYPDALNVIDLREIYETAHYRYQYRDLFIKRFGHDFHWERMRDYILHMIERVAQYVRRNLFEGKYDAQEHGNLLPARFVAGPVLQKIQQQLSNAATSSSSTDSSSSASAPLPFQFYVSEEDTILALLSAFDVLNEQKANATLPEPGAHIDFVLTTLPPTSSSSAAPISAVQINYQGRPLPISQLCASSSLRALDAQLPKPASAQFKWHSNSFQANFSASASTLSSSFDYCCTLDEFSTFVQQFLHPVSEYTQRITDAGGLDAYAKSTESMRLPPPEDSNEIVGPESIDTFFAQQGGEIALDPEVKLEDVVSPELMNLVYPPKEMPEGFEDNNPPAEEEVVQKPRPVPRPPRLIPSARLAQEPQCPFTQL